MSTSPPPPPPGSLTVDQALQQAISHHKAGQWQMAERLYRSILQAQPRHADAHHNLGMLALQVRQPLAGVPHFKAALEANPKEGQYWLSYVEALRQAGQLEAARAVLAQARGHGLRGEAVQVLADRLANAGRVDSGSGASPADGPGTDTTSVRDSSKSRKNQDDYALTVPIRAGAAATVAHPAPSMEEKNALVELFTKGRHEEAATAAREMTRRFPGDGFGWKLWGAILGQTGRYPEALAAMTRALELSPCDAAACGNLGNILRSLGRLDEAAARFYQALELNPKVAPMHYNLGNTLRDLGRLAEAEASYGRAVELKPDYVEALNNRGVLLQKLGRLTEAEGSFRRALEINPSSGDTHNNLGGTLRELERLDEAEACFRRALLLDPCDSQAHLSLGDLLTGAGKKKEAMEHFSACLKINPDDPFGARLMLAGLGGEPLPPRASDALLSRLYDKRARSWDNVTSYRGHKTVAEVLKKLARQVGLVILDAGCGTGLVGVLIRELAITLDGIDMSPAMLAKAKEKGLYDRLHQGDLVAFMASCDRRYDAITCAATLIHFGDLAPAFHAAAKSLRDEGLFILTLFPNDDNQGSEVIVAPNHSLAYGGCYAHSPAYTRRVAESAGFVVEMLETEIHELDPKGAPIMALTVALRRRAR